MDVVICICLFAFTGGILALLTFVARADLRRAQRKEAAYLLAEYCKCKESNSDLYLKDFIDDVDILRKELNK